MKLLLIILTIYTNVYGNNVSSYSNHYNSYNSIPVEQTYRRIGYTTNYSNVQFNSEVYKSPITTYNPYFDKSNENRLSNGPRRVPRDHADGSVTVTVKGYSATINWNVDANLLGWRWWTITYSDGTSEVFWGSFNEAKQHANQVAENKARQQAEERAHSVPLDDTVVSILSFLLIYTFYDLFIRYILKK